MENNNDSNLKKYIDLVQEVPYLKLVKSTKIKYAIWIIIQCIFIYTLIASYISMKDSNVCTEMSKDAQAFYILITLGFYLIVLFFQELMCNIYNSIFILIFVAVIILVLLILRRNYKLICYEDAFKEVYGEEKLKDKVFLQNQVVTDYNG